MTGVDVMAGLLLAAVALYALGLPLAWLLPAPDHSQWVVRIAVAPLYAIVLASTGATALRMAGVALHPLQLLLALVAGWVVAWQRIRREGNLRGALSSASGPLLMVGLSAMLWAMSLRGFGLYLPNQDFKNHAYFVAQVAWTRSADTNLIVRASPISPPETTDFYPLGLHTLLGWALPSTGFSSVAATAGAAVLVTSISMPLAVIALARAWRRDSDALWWVAGIVAVVFVALSNGFRIGSVVSLVVAGLYAGALAVLWEWVRQPRILSAVAVAVCGVGLLVLHVAEAMGLALVALACLPIAWGARSGQPLGRRGVMVLVILGLAGSLTSAAMLRRMLGLLDTDLVWDLQPNLEDPVTAALVAVAQEPGGMGWGRATWVVLGVLGFVVAARQGWSQVPLIAFLVPVIIGTISGLRGIPDWLGLLTAPWYGSAGRVGLMAMAPMALAGSVALVWLHEAARTRALRWAAGALAFASLAVLIIQVVPARRADLRASLAGAGDTPHVARQLKATLGPGQTVLNFDTDGTANLFAFARVPLTAGLDQDPAVAEAAVPGGQPLVERLLHLERPEVKAQLQDLGVAYIAVGTTARYWGTETGYVWQALVSQPELEVAEMGSDMVILEYNPGTRR